MDYPCLCPTRRTSFMMGAACCLTVLVSWLAPPAPARAVSSEDLDRTLTSCNLVLKNTLEMPDQGIPKDLLQRCKGLAIFPGVVGIGAVIGLSYGNGVVLRRDDRTGAWTKPTFFTVRGGSIGAQVGAQSVDLILLIMSEEGVQRLLEERFTLGADIAVSAGPVGRGATAGTSLKLDAGILSYSRSRGLFAGISLAGARVEPDDVANAEYHGRDVTVQDVFYEDKGNLSKAGEQLVRDLNTATHTGTRPTR